jgi:hypothetical protein
MTIQFDSETNLGFITRNAYRTYPDQKTIIVTGVARSGTSMVAHALSIGGMFMGLQLDDVVHEDTEIARALERRDHDALRRLVAGRDADHPVWGFKKPNLHEMLPHDTLAMFRHPYVVITYRDPIAVAKRIHLSECLDEERSLRAAIWEANQMVEFALGLPCPTLMISYEKALSFRNLFVDQMLSFCDLEVSPVVRSKMISSIEPNSKGYLANAKRNFEGYIDAVDDGIVYGWCRQINSDAAVWVDISVDGRLVTSALADTFRSDLVDAGCGQGRHGFSIDIREHLRTGHEMVGAVIQGRLFELVSPAR